MTKCITFHILQQYKQHLISEITTINNMNTTYIINLIINFIRTAKPY